MQNATEVQRAADVARTYLGAALPATVGIVLGTGLGRLCEMLTDAHSVDYADIPHFPPSTVDSHQGRLWAGRLNSVPVLLQQGRCHLYEGYSPAQVCMGVRVMARLGVRTLVLTNAAGALNPLFDAGRLMCISDHINMTGQSPLTGPNCDAFGPRFPDMSTVYDAQLIAKALSSATSLGLRLERGVYVGVCGPQMETPAETRFFRHMGADAIGMSTVLEAIAARHMGLRVLAIACLANKNLPDCMAEAPLEEIIRVAGEAGQDVTRLLYALLPRLDV